MPPAAANTWRVTYILASGEKKKKKKNTHSTHCDAYRTILTIQNSRLAHSFQLRRNDYRIHCVLLSLKNEIYTFYKAPHRCTRLSCKRFKNETTVLSNDFFGQNSNLNRLNLLSKKKKKISLSSRTSV